MRQREWTAETRASRLYADLKGLPPTLIQVGSTETLLDDAVRFAAAAGEAHVSATLEIWPYMIHAWPPGNARLEPGRRCARWRILREHL